MGLSCMKLKFVPALVLGMSHVLVMGSPCGTSSTSFQAKTYGIVGLWHYTTIVMFGWALAGPAFARIGRCVFCMLTVQHVTATNFSTSI